MKVLSSIFSLFVVFSYSGAQAYELAAVAGLRTTEVNATGPGLSENGGSGIMFGILGFAESSNEFYVRSGAIYTQRKFDLKVGGNKAEYTINYIDVPANALYMFNETFGIYGGLLMSLKLSADCDANGLNCSDDDEESLVYGLNFGGHMRFAPNFGLEVEYLMGMSNVLGDDQAGAEKAGGVAVNFAYLF